VRRLGGTRKDSRGVVDRHCIVRWTKFLPGAFSPFSALPAIDIAAGEATDLAALAIDLCYFDQAHFGNDFRRYVGVPPAAYAAAA
jgi:AraC-like DNA-binding protein